MAVPVIQVFEQRARTVRASQGSLEITRDFYLEPYLAYPRVMEALMGTVRLVGRRLVRVPPLRDPHHPWCYCTDVSVEMVHPEAVSAGGPFASAALAVAAAETITGGALVRTVWKSPDASTADSRDNAGGPGTTPQQERDLAEESFTYGAKNITLPNERLKWEGTSEALVNTNVQAVKTVPSLDYTLTRHFVLKLPHRALTQLMGKINNDELRVASVTWPPETMRLDGASARRKISILGLPFYDLTLRWAIQPAYEPVEDGASNDPDWVGWNRFFRPDTGLWEYAEWVSTAERVYLHDTTVTQTGFGIDITGFDLLFTGLSN